MLTQGEGVDEHLSNDLGLPCWCGRVHERVEPDLKDLIPHEGDCSGTLCETCGCCYHTPEDRPACGCTDEACQCVMFKSWRESVGLG